MADPAARLPALVVLRRASASLRWGASIIDAMLASHPRFTATPVGNVETAVELFRARPFPLVLVEWTMLGGPDLIRRLRQMPGGDRTWICAVAHDAPDAPSGDPGEVDEWLWEVHEQHYQGRFDAAAAELERRGWSPMEAGSEALPAIEDDAPLPEATFEGLSEKLVLGDLLSQFPGLIYVLRIPNDQRLAQFDLISQGCEALYGVRHAEVLADPGTLLRMIHPEDLSIYATAAGHSMRTLEPMRCEIRICGADGVVRYTDLRAALRRSADGEIRSTGIMLDITARREAEELLRQAKDVAEAASRAKSLFLGNVSHELRTPMNAILGLVDLLVTDETVPRRRRHLETVRDSSVHLLALLDDLLDLQRIEADRLELAVVPFDPRRLFEDVVALMEPQAVAHGLRLSVDLAGDLPSSLAGDPVRVRQVVTNLVGNALKFSDVGGQARVTVGFTPAGDGGVLSVEVEDSGIGVPEHDRARIFDSFEQVDAGASRSRGGLGLGLPISRRLAERMGGTLVLVEAEPGRGSVFRFECRLALAACAPGRMATPPLLRGPLLARPILVAEDHPFNREVMLALLERLGIDAEVALDGAQAVELAASGRFALVLMDCQMPAVDGLTATEQIRQREGAAGSARVPIVAVTAHAVVGFRQRCLIAGMDDVLHKPVTLSSLAAALARWVGATPPVPRVADTEPASALDATILGSLPRDRRDRLIALFLEDIPPRVAALRDAAARADVEHLENGAHCLAGASAFLHAVTMRALCDDIVATARANAPGKAHDLIERLVEEFQRVRIDLSAVATTETGMM